MDSTNHEPPFFGPEHAVYPALDHIVRVVGLAVDASGRPLGTNVYNGFIQQWNPTLRLRDREAVYVWEPNGNLLLPGYYDARLVGPFNQLPLLVTWCCGRPASSSSSSSS